MNISAPFNSSLFKFLDLDLLRSRILWLIRLRWIALLGYLSAIFTIYFFLELNIEFGNFIALFILLLIANISYRLIMVYWQKLSFKGELAFVSIQIVFDLLLLTYLVHNTGGQESPIYIFYVFHVVISSIIFPSVLPWIVAHLVIFLFVGLVLLEYNGILSHNCLFQIQTFNHFEILILTVLVFSLTVYAITYFCVTFMRIYRETKARVDAQNDKLLALDSEKSQFFRFTSHELKAPLVSTKSTIDSILNVFGQNLDPKASKMLGRASNRIAQMIDIIKELLELSGAVQPDVDAKKAIVNLESVITQTIDTMSESAAEKKQTIHWKESQTKYGIIGINKDFEQIFLNLISNAIRYTPKNGKITVTAVENKNGFGYIVSDTGIGIEEDEIDKIFSEFYRTQKAKEESNFGTGLGLSIVKKNVDKYNGTIKVDSSPGKGTAFTVLFPFEHRKRIKK
jgi:signal transduction histidine kinase